MIKGSSARKGGYGMAYDITEAKRLVIEAGHRLQAEGLIVRTWGNISARISDTQFVVTPSGKAYEGLTEDDIVIVNIKDCSYEGFNNPSSECGIHADVYAMRPEVNFVIHTHQIYATAISILGQDVELTDEEKPFLGDRIPCAAYGMSSSEKLRKQVKKTLKKSAGCSSMLLRNHGVLCMGSDLENAFEISSIMEQVCKYKYNKLTSGFDKVKVMEEEMLNEEVKPADDGVELIVDENAAQISDADRVEWAGDEDLNPAGFVDYGISHIEGENITLTLGEKEYTYNRGDKKPLGRGLFKRNINKVALIHSRIYEDRNVSCIYHVTLPNIVDVSKKTAKGFVPYVDDQAQIVGEYVRVIGKIGKKAHFESASAIVKGLKGNGAVLIAGQGAICVGSNESDVEATAYVLEKGCVAMKLALCHPEAESVPKRIAAKERQFYVDTYSKLI